MRVYIINTDSVVVSREARPTKHQPVLASAR